MDNLDLNSKESFENSGYLILLIMSGFLDCRMGKIHSREDSYDLCNDANMFPRFHLGNSFSEKISL